MYMLGDAECSERGGEAPIREAFSSDNARALYNIVFMEGEMTEYHVGYGTGFVMGWIVCYLGKAVMKRHKELFRYWKKPTFHSHKEDI